MKNRLAALRGPLKRFRLGEIAGDDLAINTRQIAPVAVWADEGADVVAGFDQTTQHGRTDKTRRTGQ